MSCLEHITHIIMPAVMIASDTFVSATHWLFTDSPQNRLGMTMQNIIHAAMIFTGELTSPNLAQIQGYSFAPLSDAPSRSIALTEAEMCICWQLSICIHVSLPDLGS